MVEERLDNRIVDGLRPLSHGGEEVHKESELDPEVVGDHAEEEASEVVQESEDAEDNPVGQPLFVVIRAVSLECLNALSGRVEDSNSQGQNGGSEDTQSDN